VGVQVAVEPGKQGKLRRRLPGRWVARIDRHHAAGVPVGELLWTPVGDTPVEAEVHELGHDGVGKYPGEESGDRIEVAGKADKEGADCGGETLVDPVSRSDRSGEPVGGGHERRVEPGESEVVRERRPGSRQGRQQRRQQVAAVVVVDGLTREPHRLRRERSRPVQCGEQAEIEELLADRHR